MIEFSQLFKVYSFFYSSLSLNHHHLQHGAHGKAFNLFNKMQEKGIQTSLHGYNALISAVTSIRTDYKDRWEVLVVSLYQRL